MLTGEANKQATTSLEAEAPATAVKAAASTKQQQQQQELRPVHEQEEEDAVAAASGKLGSNGSSRSSSSSTNKRACTVSSPSSAAAAMPSTDSHSSADDISATTLFPVEDIVQNPLPGYVAPSSVSFSPDDKLVCYLFSPDATLSRKIFAFDPETRQQLLLVSPPNGGVDECNLSTPEKLRRERLRERGLGVTRYEWAKTAHLMVPLPGGIYVQDGLGAELRLRVASTSWSPIIDPQLSPDGLSIAYVRDDEIHVVDIPYGEPRQITYNARSSGKTHGLAEYIAQEEMERRNGFWWSSDSKMIAFTEVDGSAIPPFRIMHQGKSSVGGDAEEDHAYPFAGQSNVKLRVGVVPVASAGGEVTWMDLQCGTSNEEEYLARVMWMPDNSLTAQVLSRDHSKLKLLKFDIRTGRQTLLLQETSDVWINLHDCFTPLHKGSGQLAGGFIWASERSGFRHLYLYDGAGFCLGAVTQGQWMVEQIAGVDEEAAMVYFTATMDSPLETHLYSTRLLPVAGNCGSGVKRLTRGEGRHLVVLDHQMHHFVDIHDSLDMPPCVLLCSLADGRLIVPIFEQPALTPRTRKLRLAPPELVQMTANDGTSLHGAVYKPDMKEFGPPPYKTVVSVYGGPNVQTVCSSWMNTVDMRAQYLRSRGILVWKLDNRGSARRGLKFEGAIKNNMGHVDVEDQEAGVQWLIRQGLALPGKIGIYGWSYGGYLAAMALARCSETFKCAVAGAPVTAWDGYDTYYTEKFMGFPATNQAGYEASAVMHHAHRISGKLLLVHGMIDENVHFRHSARLINALIAAGKEYELLVFPDERHMPRGLRDRMYMEERICEFLERNL